MPRKNDITLSNPETVAFLREFRTENVIYSGPEGKITVVTAEFGSNFIVDVKGCYNPVIWDTLPEAISFLRDYK